MPSWELFEQQDQAYRDGVCCPDVTARVSVEMGSVIGWDRYVGADGRQDRNAPFGASAPLKDLLRNLGLREAVVAAAKEQIAKSGRDDVMTAQGKTKTIHEPTSCSWVTMARRYGSTSSPGASSPRAVSRS